MMSAEFSVTELTNYIKSYITASPTLARVSVRGEASNCSAPSGKGHIFFTLKDEGAVLRAVIFKSAAEKLDFKLENGMTLICEGRISVYPQGGQYLLYADKIKPEGTGDLYVAFELLKKKLQAEGLFDSRHKQLLPKTPLSVGVITSATGAAVRDIINVSGRRFPSAKIVVYPSLVQGEGAAAELCAGVEYFNCVNPVDVIIIGRGGGSIEELWAFNDEKLARTIFKSVVPVVSAVGHETDFTICDFVADLRAPTPSAAAEMALPDRSDMLRRLGNAENRIIALMTQRIREERRVLASLASAAVLRSPTAAFDERRLHILRLEERLDRAMQNRVKLVKYAFDSKREKLLSLDPNAVLKRGYAAVFTEDGRVVKSVNEVKDGDGLVLRVADGEIGARAETKKQYGEMNHE